MGLNKVVYKLFKCPCCCWFFSYVCKIWF